MKRRILMLVGIVCALAPDSSQACNVPAFRYALERWPADPYQILVYYEANLEADALRLLQKGAANCTVRRIDAATPEGRALAEERKITRFPWVEVFYPVHFRSGDPLWSGPLEPGPVKAILDSPARSEIARRLLAGEVAVWVLVKSGREQEDARALKTLKTHLERASATLRMPVMGTDLHGNPIEVHTFKSYPVHFGVLEIARGDGREELLVRALLNSEPDLAQHDEPIAFPVFGRGRALYALVGNGIQDKTIVEACQSLLAWCSCEIKAQSPGTDLLISADWSRPFGGKMVEDELPPLAGVAAFGEDVKGPATVAGNPAPQSAEQARAACPLTPPSTRAATADSAATAAPPAAPTSRQNPLIRNVIYLAAGAGLVLVGLSVFVTVRAKR